MSTSLRESLLGFSTFINDRSNPETEKHNTTVSEKQIDSWLSGSSGGARLQMEINLSLFYIPETIPKTLEDEMYPPLSRDDVIKNILLEIKG